jgi:DNA polymerase III subunit chi
MEVSFYHLSSVPLEKALPRLLEKILEKKQHKIIIKVINDEMLKVIDNVIWTFASRSFVPHGTKNDKNPELQPIYITDSDEIPNNADIFVNLTESSYVGNNFAKIIEMFDGSDELILANARKKYKEYKLSNYDLIYWKQQEDGSWQKN